MPNNEHDQNNERIVLKTPPKVAFAMGVMAGIALTSLTAFIMTYALLRSNMQFSQANSTTNTAKVAGVDTTQTNTNQQAAPVKVNITEKSDDHIRGDKNAKVTLVEYSDFECPFCGKLIPTLDKIMDEYKGKVKLIFRHFPLSSIHPNAQKAAEASECASDQGKFWEMHDKMFAEQDNLGIDSLKAMAKSLGLNSSKFNECLDSGKYAKKVADSEEEGTAYGVKGTPTTFVNGTLISGSLPYDSFKQVIDSALAAN